MSVYGHVNGQGGYLMLRLTLRLYTSCVVERPARYNLALSLLASYRHGPCSACPTALKVMVSFNITVQTTLQELR